MKSKQEVINELCDMIDKTKEPLCPDDERFWWGMFKGLTHALFLIQQTDVGISEPVPVPLCVAETMNKYRTEFRNGTFYGYLQLTSIESSTNDESDERKVFDWLKKPENESKLMKVWLDGRCLEIVDDDLEEGE